MTTTLCLFNFILFFFFVNGFNSSSTSSSYQRIFCVIKTFGKNLATRALSIHQTWARRCDKHVFLTATNLTEWNNISLPVLNLLDVGDNYLELSVKVFDALNLIIAKPQPYDFDWLLMTDDDTYVIIEHLRELLYPTTEPLAFGHVYRPQGVPSHFSGGAGYVINAVALQRMLPDLQTTCSPWYIPGMEDVYVSRCLQHLNVTLNGAIHNNHHQFYPLEFLTMYTMDFPEWYTNFNTLKSHPGFDCCSSKSITFHYMTREWMNVIEWARYLHTNQ